LKSHKRTLQDGIIEARRPPPLRLLDVAFIYKALMIEDINEMSPDPVLSTNQMTPLEQHFLHCLGGVGLMLLINNVAAICVENSHYRGMAVLLNIIFFATDAYSYVNMGLEVPTAVYVIVGLGVIGLIVHANEPGIFTKDHDKKKTK